MFQHLQRDNNEGTNTNICEWHSAPENATADVLKSWVGKHRDKIRNKWDISGMVQQLDLHPQSKKTV